MERTQMQQANHSSKMQKQDQWQQQEQQFSSDSEEYSFRQFLKKEKLRKRKQKIQYFKKVKSNGFWTTHQNRLYLEFLKKNRSSFVSQKSKRSARIFRKMSMQIKTRSSLQCRSHHQKIEANYSNIDELIEEVSKKVTAEEKYNNLELKDSRNNKNHIQRIRAQIRQIRPNNDQNRSQMNKTAKTDNDDQLKSIGYKTKIQIISTFIETYV